LIANFPDDVKERKKKMKKKAEKGKIFKKLCGERNQGGAPLSQQRVVFSRLVSVRRHPGGGGKKGRCLEQKKEMGTLEGLTSKQLIVPLLSGEAACKA